MPSLVDNLSRFQQSLNSLENYLTDYGKREESNAELLSDPVEIELHVVLQTISLFLPPLKTLLKRSESLGRRNATRLRIRDVMDDKEDEHCPEVEGGFEIKEEDTESNVGEEEEFSEFIGFAVAEEGQDNKDQPNVPNHIVSDAGIDSDPDSLETDGQEAFEPDFLPGFSKEVELRPTDATSRYLSTPWPPLTPKKEYYHCLFSPCKYKSVRRHLVTRHMLSSKHSVPPRKDSSNEELKHFCEKCGKGFVTTNSLYHHRTAHQKARPFACRHCTARFKRRKDCKEHEGTHVTEKKHQCPTCQKMFKTSGSLRCHKYTHTRRLKVPEEIVTTGE